MSVITTAERRITSTPNATMTTLCSPTLGGAGLSLWQAAMAPGAAQPWHRMDGEQVLTVVTGSVTIDHEDGPATVLGIGDTAVVAAHGLRRARADDEAGAVLLCASAAPLRAVDAEGTDRGVPDWIA